MVCIGGTTVSPPSHQSQASTSQDHQHDNNHQSSLSSLPIIIVIITNHRCYHHQHDDNHQPSLSSLPITTAITNDHCYHYQSLDFGFNNSIMITAIVTLSPIITANIINHSHHHQPSSPMIKLSSSPSITIQYSPT